MLLPAVYSRSTILESPLAVDVAQSSRQVHVNDGQAGRLAILKFFLSLAQDLWPLPRVGWTRSAVCTFEPNERRNEESNGDSRAALPLVDSRRRYRPDGRRDRV